MTRIGKSSSTQAPAKAQWPSSKPPPKARGAAGAAEAGRAKDVWSEKPARAKGGKGGDVWTERPARGAQAPARGAQAPARGEAAPARGAQAAAQGEPKKQDFAELVRTALGPKVGQR